MRKTLIILFALMMVTSFAWAEEIGVVINGAAVEMNTGTGVPFVDANGRTSVPLRATLEKFGADVQWLSAERTVRIEKNGVVVKVPVDVKQIDVNGKTIDIDTAAVVVDGRVYLPIRAVMEAFGATVTWDGQQRAVLISTSQTTVPKKETAVAPVATVPAVNVNSGGYRTLTSYDLRKSDRLTEVKDQGRSGTCWIFTVIDQIECMMRPARVLDLSEDHIVHNSDFHIDYQSGGVDEIIISYLASWKGPVLESEDPFFDHKTNPSAKPIAHFQDMYVRNMDVDEIKEVVYKYGAVKTDVYMDERIGVYLDGDTGAYNYNGDEPANHSVMIVGWDDKFPKSAFPEEPEGDGAFIVKNSWGGAFGKLGYFYVSYYDKTIGGNTLVLSDPEPVSNFSNIYQHETTYPLYSWGYGIDSCWGANVFKKQSLNEALSAVGFYTMEDNTEYIIGYVDNFNTVKSFEDLQFISSGKIENRGYYSGV